MPTAQHPLHSGFSRITTAAEALGDADLTGRLAIVTGGYSGIGLETVRVLSLAGATILVPARDMEKARTALALVPRVEIHSLDLADPVSIDGFANGFAESGRAIDLLIANAGIMATPLSHDGQGCERQLATNHLGHFQLTARLWPGLRRASNARVVVLSSGAHRFSGVDFDDPNYHHRPYDKWKAYGQSKTANALFALGLDQRGEPHGIRAFSVHPGVIDTTDLQRHTSLEDLQAMGFRDADGNVPPGIASRYKSVEQGAATTVWCAVSPRLAGEGGVYCEDCDVARASTDITERVGVVSWATDQASADALWTMSERFTGIVFAP